jgi:predicted Co/Zn/Cd cation transporter (cation efflux family)
MLKSSLVKILVALVMCMAFLAIPVATVQAAAATVTSINPNSGHQGDSISATITGSGFTAATRVRIKDGYGNDIIYAYTGGFTILSTLPCQADSQ